MLSMGSDLEITSSMIQGNRLSVRLGPSELGDGYSNVDISVRVYQGSNESMKGQDQSYVS